MLAFVCAAGMRMGDPENSDNHGFKLNSNGGGGERRTGTGFRRVMGRDDSVLLQSFEGVLTGETKSVLEGLAPKAEQQITYQDKEGNTSNATCYDSWLESVDMISHIW